MAGTNEFAFFFAVKAYVPGGGGPESGRKKFEKCLPAGTGTKIYFSSKSPIKKMTRNYYENNSPLARGKKINANFFCTKFLNNPSGHGRPRRKSWTSAPTGTGTKIYFSSFSVCVIG